MLRDCDIDDEAVEGGEALEDEPPKPPPPPTPPLLPIVGVLLAARAAI
jgi:hypothetical protein